jgi:hypothetical protein
MRSPSPAYGETAVGSRVCPAHYGPAPEQALPGGLVMGWTEFRPNLTLKRRLRMCDENPSRPDKPNWYLATGGDWRPKTTKAPQKIARLSEERAREDSNL